MSDAPYGEWQEMVDAYVQKGWQAEGAGEKYILLQRPSPARTSLAEEPEIDNRSGDLAESQWWVYLLLCADATYYCGVTTNPERREHEHNTSLRGAKYTRSRRPVKAVYCEGPMSKSEALKRELRVKALKRSEKAALAASGGP